MSIRIANSRGTPGTLACLARTVHQDRLVFLTSYHVLFAAGAGRHEPVWQVRESGGRHSYRSLGSALRGRRGVVRFGGDDYFVDCAIGVLDAMHAGESRRAAPPAAAPRCGERVTKAGAASGTTTGVIVDASYDCSTDAGAAASGRVHTPRQFLIRSVDPARPFSQDGDSGALVVNDDNAPVGLLWGSTVAADGVACPIAPVLHALNIRLCETRP